MTSPTPGPTPGPAPGASPGPNPYGPVPEGVAADEPMRRYNWAELARKHRNPRRVPPPDRRRKAGMVFDRALDPALERERDRPPHVRGDVGHAVSFVTAHADRLCYVPETGMFHTWNGHLWERDVSGRAQHLYTVWAAQLRDWSESQAAAQQVKPADMKRLLSTAGMNSVLAIAKSDPRIAAPLEWFDAEVEEVNTPDGVWDLRDGALMGAPDPARLVRRSLTRAPDPSVPTPLFDRFLAQTFAGDPEAQEYVRRMLGLSLLASQDTQTFMYLYGKTGANGKGTLMTLMQRIMGTDETGYSITVNPSLIEKRNTDKHETEIAQLAGVRMAVTSEVGSSDMFDVNKVKRLVSGETMSGRFMGKDYFSFAPTHTLWVMTNTHIKADATDSAFWRRLREVGFHHSTPAHERIEGLGDRMYDQEGPGIVAWLLEGARRYLSDGLETPESVEAAGRAYIRENDTVAAWAGDSLTSDDPEAFTKASTLRESYLAWCKLNGFRPLGRNQLGDELETAGWPRAKSNGLRGHRGVSFIGGATV